MDDANVQKGSIYIVEFNVSQGKSKVPELAVIGGKVSLHIECAIYVPIDFSEINLNKNNFIYFTAFANEKAVSQQLGVLPLDPNYSLFKYDVDFNFKVPEGIKNIGFQAAYTNKQSSDPEIAESLHYGRFFKTYIPIKQEGINGN